MQVLSWLGHYGYCIAETASGGVPGAPGEGYPYDDCYRTINLARGLHADHTLVEELLDDGTCQVRCEAPDRLFVAAFYFTLQMICGATGGPFDREGFDVWEQIIFAFLTAIGALVWGQVIGTVVSVVANANSDVTWFRSTMDELNQFMHLYSLPQETRMRLREYVLPSSPSLGLPSSTSLGLPSSPSLAGTSHRAAMCGTGNSASVSSSRRALMSAPMSSHELP